MQANLCISIKDLEGLQPVLLLLIALSSRIDLVVQELLDLLKPLFFGEYLTAELSVMQLLKGMMDLMES